MQLSGGTILPRRLNHGGRLRVKAKQGPIIENDVGHHRPASTMGTDLAPGYIPAISLLGHLIGS